MLLAGRFAAATNRSDATPVSQLCYVRFLLFKRYASHGFHPLILRSYMRHDVCASDTNE